MADKVSVALVGLGGYGGFYLSAILDDPAGAERVELVGGVDPAPERCARLDDLKEMGVPIYASLEDFYARRAADLTVISSPIQFHCEQTCLALEHGSHVLCEKPLCAVVQDAGRMADARDRAGRFAAIGYQWSFSAAVRALRSDVAAGLFGAPVRCKTIALWPRRESYYSRNDWAGAVRDREGRWVLDSPVNNAVSHYLHNMFYLLGAGRDAGARPAEVTGELYRANDIGNYDTAALRCRTVGGTDVLFFASHAVGHSMGPITCCEFERARVFYTDADRRMQAVFADGRVKDYGDPNEDAARKLWDAVAAARGGGGIVCGIDESSAQTLCMNGLQDSAPDVAEFPAGMIVEEGEPGDRLRRVRGLEEVFVQCFDAALLPSELSVAWSRPGRPVDLTNYHSFPGGDR